MERLVLSVRVDVPFDQAGFRVGSNDAIKAAVRSYFGDSVGRLDVERNPVGNDCTLFKITFMDGYQDEDSLTIEHVKRALGDLLSDKDAKSLVALRFFH